MRRLCTALLIFLAMLASSATARTFRTDLFDCGGTLAGLADLEVNQPDVQYCWGNIPREIQLRVKLPTDKGTSHETYGGTGGISALGFVHRQAIFNYIIQVFDYPQFLRDIGDYPAGATLDRPRVETSNDCTFTTCIQISGTRGLARRFDPANNNPFDVPLLRINWFLDPAIPALYPAFAGVFEDGNDINGVNYFGAQLVFYGDGSQPLLDPRLAGVAFELNGIKDFRYFTATLTVSNQNPCGRWDIDGRSLCTPKLQTSASPVAVGTPFTLTATITGTAPTGTVSFRTPLAALPNCTSVPLAGTGDTRTAQCAVSSLNVGSYSLTAAYSGDGANIPATATIAQVVSANAGLPCGGFSDVDPSSGFCSNVEWLKNREVTVGCGTGTTYCPDQGVIRLQMAAFMNRLGTAITDDMLSMQGQSGAVNLDVATVLCQTSDFAVEDFPRRAVVDATLSAQGAANVNFAADAVASLDSGQTWVPMANTPAAASAFNTNWGNVRVAGVRDLDVGQNVRFGVRIARAGLPGAGGLSATRCNLRSLIGNATMPYSPLDSR